MLFAYVGFAFLFEVTFTRLQNEIVVDARKEDLGGISAFSQSLNSASLALTIPIFGLMVDSSSVPMLSFSISMLVFFVSILFLILRRRNS